mmetsp:Transcript_59473/g.142767  ORF Transcript_59473/g.142767 Transcript_59473/m.142767 type:complete len:268 (+) Transcript_59473:34-837(+)
MLSPVTPLVRGGTQRRQLPMQLAIVILRRAMCCGRTSPRPVHGSCTSQRSRGTHPKMPAAPRRYGCGPAPPLSGGEADPSMHMATAAAHLRPPRCVLARPASHARDDLHDGHAAIADRDGLLGAGGAHEGQRRVEHLLLGGEGREEADVRAPLHKARRVEAQDERALARTVLHGHLQAGRGRHRGQLRAAQREEFVRHLGVAHPTPEIHRRDRSVFRGTDRTQSPHTLVHKRDRDGERVRPRALGVAQRSVDRLVDGGGVEAQREHV